MGRIFSGVQPTGNLHLGNYLGAIRNWVKLQAEGAHETIFCIVDLHAITVPQNPLDLLNATREVTAAYIACGIDPEKSIIFPQSAISAHAELAWILSCHAPLGWLNRMTQFKEKINAAKNDAVKQRQQAAKFLALILEGKEKGDALNISDKDLIKLSNIFEVAAKEEEKKFENANLGLYSYPVLMAADILAYKATHVPVGQDQKQHLELARDIAGAFNRAYKQEYFPLPEPLIQGTATRVMSLRDGTKKMSKSDESDYSRINMTDDADTIAKKFQKAKSDMLDGITYDEAARPECSNLINIYAALAGGTREKVQAEFAGKNFSTFKKALADLSTEQLAPITAHMRELMKDTAHIDGILKRGAERAGKLAGRYLGEVKEMIGFVRV